MLKNINKELEILEEVFIKAVKCSIYEQLGITLTHNQAKEVANNIYRETRYQVSISEAKNIL